MQVIYGDLIAVERLFFFPFFINASRYNTLMLTIFVNDRLTDWQSRARCQCAPMRIFTIIFITFYIIMISLFWLLIIRVHQCNCLGFINVSVDSVWFLNGFDKFH